MIETESRPGSLLDEALFCVREKDGPERMVSLPDVLEELELGHQIEFVKLRPHQQHAWHAFLVQIAAMALHLCGPTRGQRSQWWKSALLKLAGDQERAWWLVNADLAQPAFMQPPVPEGTLAGFNNEVRAPDGIDVIITAKNHDVKTQRMVRATAEQWIFALVSKQTMGAYGGRSLYGTVRMNTGAGSRPAVAVAAAPSLAKRFLHDVGAMIQARPSALRMPPNYAASGGICLLWLPPWDGYQQLQTNTLDPFFVEICRRVRMVRSDTGKLLLRTGTSNVQRTAGEDFKGNTGDLWTPVNVAKDSALTASAGSFRYARFGELLFGPEYRQAPAQAIQDGDGDHPVVIAQVLVGGNCTSDGYHERLLQLTPAVRSRLSSEGGMALLRLEFDTRRAMAEMARRKVLRPALLVLLQGAPDKIKFDDDRADSRLAAFDAEIDAEFFDQFFAALEATDRSADPGATLARSHNVWAAWLLARAMTHLETALSTETVPVMRRLKAQVAAESMFHAATRREFPSIVAENSNPQENVH